MKAILQIVLEVSLEVIIREGSKHPERIINSNKSSTSVIIAATGDAVHYFLLMYIYREKYLHKLKYVHPLKSRSLILIFSLGLTENQRCFDMPILKFMNGDNLAQRNYGVTRIGIADQKI